MDALAKLGVDWKLFLAQAINFLILLFILQRFAYKPMLKFLSERSERIEKGLRDAEASRKKLEEISVQEKETLDQARREAKALIAEAESAAKKRDAERMAATEARAQAFLAEAEEKIAAERERALRDAKAEIGELVAQSVEKLLHEKVDSAKDKELIQKVLS